MICAFSINVELKAPTGSSITFPSSNVKSFVTISIICFPSGTSISLACISALDTSLEDIPEYLSLASFVTLFCTIVTYFPGIVMYAEFIFMFISFSASCTTLDIESAKLFSSTIFPFCMPLLFLLVLQITSI